MSDKHLYDSDGNHIGTISDDPPDDYSSPGHPAVGAFFGSLIFGTPVGLVLAYGITDGAKKKWDLELPYWLLVLAVIVLFFWWLLRWFRSEC